MVSRYVGQPVSSSSRIGPRRVVLAGEVSVTIDSIPDVTSVIGPINKLKDLAMKCTDELDAYSRFVGRHPDKAGAAEAAGLLPDVLLASRGGPVVADLRGWASERLTGRSRAVVSVDDLVGRWSPGRTTKLTKRETVSLAALLGKLGVGVEPDVRFGAPTPKPGSKAVLFRLPEGSSTAPSAAYHRRDGAGSFDRARGRCGRDNNRRGAAASL